MKTTERLVMVPLAEIIPDPNNARIHPEDQVRRLRESLREFGFVRPLLIDGGKRLISGHGTLAAALAEEVREAPCVLVEHLSEAQRRAYILADNRLAELAEWDMETVGAELAALADLGVDVGLTGFGLEDLAAPDLEDGPGAVEDDYELDLPAEPRSRPGEIYLLGRHRLMCGDSTDRWAVDRLMDGVSADLLLTDPPYNVALGREGDTDKARKRHRRTDGVALANDALTDAEYQGLVTAALGNADHVMLPGAAFYLWHASTVSRPVWAACAAVGWPVRQQLVWNKQAFTLGRQDYQWKHEPCLYGWKEGASHHWNGGRAQSTVLDYDRPTRSEEHPTMKPVTLFDRLIQNSCAPGGVVLDLFAGSGTTAVACEQNGRAAYLMELDPRFVDVIIDRWETLTGLKAEKVV